MAHVNIVLVLSPLGTLLGLSWVLNVSPYRAQRYKSFICVDCSTLFSSHPVTQRQVLAALLIMSGSHGDTVLLPKLVV